MGKKKLIFSRFKRKILKHVWIVRATIIFALIFALYFLVLLSRNLLSRFGADYYINLARNFILVPKENIKSLNEKTNILILGKGGVDHEAPDLTDTIIFVSVDHAAKKISFISLPRDIWIKALRTKLNSIYYWGNQKKPPVEHTFGPEGIGGGLVLAKSTVEEIIGQPIHYGVVLDFSGFKKIIEIIGGVEVEVKRAFIDEKYPIPGREDSKCEGDPEFKCRYETISFEKGKQLMDAETALKFVRSRNAEGDEGTDFARQERQQEVIEALKTKVLSREILLSPKKLGQLRDATLESLESDVNPNEATILARRFLQSRDNIKHSILPESLLINPPKSPKYDNLYVFIPKDESLSEIHEWVKCVLENRGSCS